MVKATEVPDGFNAIGSCLKKEYTYRIYNSRVKNPFYVNRAYFYPKRLDEEFLNRAAHQFVGTHDFAAVRSVGTETRTTVRTIYCRREVPAGGYSGHSGKPGSDTGGTHSAAGGTVPDKTLV